MTDWADEIVSSIPANYYGLKRNDVAAALRKAKADGMREAAMMASEYSAATHGYLPSDPFSAAEKCRDEIVSGLKLAASKLSPT